MNINQDDIQSFHLPRWNELPDMELYVDQVVTTLEKKLSILTECDAPKIITSSMINNYVKQKVVTPPVKKRYDRTHLSYLFVVCILKRIMSISEICESIKIMREKYGVEVGYNTFCDEFEAALRLTFSGSESSNGLTAEERSEMVAIKAASLAIANLILAKRIIKADIENARSRKEGKRA